MRRPAQSYRLDEETTADIAALAVRLRLTATGVIREAVRRLAAAELGRAGRKKVPKKSPTGIGTGDTDGKTPPLT